MYAFYERYRENGIDKLSFEEEISLAGCNAGIIVELLRKQLKPEHNPPLGWTVLVSDWHASMNSVVIIDIKPGSDEHFLCELDRAFGYTFDTFTPIMYRLKVLYNEEAEDDFDKSNFDYPANPEIIYTMSYMMGSIRDGKIVGKWNPPKRSPANSVLLWDEALSFFFSQIEKTDPRFTSASFRSI